MTESSRIAREVELLRAENGYVTQTPGSELPVPASPWLSTSRLGTLTITYRPGR